MLLAYTVYEWSDTDIGYGIHCCYEDARQLALEMEGRLGEEMFRFYQRGGRSLINFEEKKMSSEILS